MQFLLLRDMFDGQCPMSAEVGGGLRILLDALISCWSPQCKEPSEAMRYAQNDCEYVSAALRWMSKRDRETFDLLTQRNLQQNLQLLHQTGVTDADLLAINAAVKSHDVRRLQSLVEKLMTPESQSLLAALSLIVAYKIPGTVRRSAAAFAASQGMLSFWGETPAQISLAAPFAAHALTATDYLFQGEVLLFDGQIWRKITPKVINRAVSVRLEQNSAVFASGFRVELLTRTNLIYFLMKGILTQLDWQTGEVKGLRSNGELFESDISAIARPATDIEDGCVNVSDWQICLVSVPEYDAEDHQRHNQWMAWLTRNERRYQEVTGETPSLALL